MEYRHLKGVVQISILVTSLTSTLGPWHSSTTSALVVMTCVLLHVVGIAIVVQRLGDFPSSELIEYYGV